MFDAHYDLLTILYECYLKDDFSYIQELKKELKDVKALVANLYFMSEEEMKVELNIEKIDVVEMFKISTHLCQKYFNDKNIIYSIEGCDYIDDKETLRDLAKIGLKSILLVWNNENKYGSGIRREKGLTKLGREFLEEAAQLGLIIDLSHMNERTFYDAIDLIKEMQNKGIEVKVMASHSNSYAICDNKRNLKDEQIEKLREVGGYLGLVLYKPFISNEKRYEEKFLEHVKHLQSIFPVNRLMIGSDDMLFMPELLGVPKMGNIYNHKDMKDMLEKLLLSVLDEESVQNILINNGLERIK